MKNRTKSPLFLIFSITFLVLSAVSIHALYPALNLTVETDKPHYYPKPSDKIVQIYGNLTLDGTPVTDGLVAVQIQDPRDQLVTIRTLLTGTIPPTTPYVKVWDVTPCNSSGDPQSSFKRKSLAYFKIRVTNYDVEPRSALMTVVIYNPDNIPFGSASIKTTLSPQTTTYYIISIPIPSDATLGTSIAYANAYTDWPKLAGTPHCNEVNATFQVIAGTLQSTQTERNQSVFALQTDGNYSTTLNLSVTAKPGIYTIYVATRYQSEEAFNSITFRVLILGDMDKDGDIDWMDLFLFGDAYVYEYVPEADLNDDGNIDWQDLFIFGNNYIK